jgi:hypothetical protein
MHADRTVSQGSTMNLPQLCIQRPVMTTLLMAAFMVFGTTSYQKLPISALPKVDFPGTETPTQAGAFRNFNFWLRGIGLGCQLSVSNRMP